MTKWILAALLIGVTEAVAAQDAELKAVPVPGGLRHYEGGKGRTVIVLYGTGPLTANFVRPECT